MDNLSDMDLVREYAASNSDAAFAELVRRRINLVYSVAFRRLGDPHAAEEVTQAVFIILARKAASLRPETVISGWLYQTAQLTAANFQRALIRRHRHEQEALMQFVEESEAEASWQHLQPHLEDAMAGLNAKERDAVVLRFFEGRTVGEVAAELKVNEAAAQKRVNRATEKLRKFFTRRGVKVSAGVLIAAIGANSIQAAPASLATAVTGVAVIKGTAASISTLALIQSTLKIMAWTKLKTSVVVAAVLLLGGGAGVVAVKTFHYVRVSRYPNLTGAWEGTLEAQGAKLRLVLKMAKKNGVYVATMDSIDQSSKDLTVDQVVYDYPNFSLEMKTISGSYKAKLNATTSEMTGTWKQIGPLPLTLKRTTTPDIVPDPLTAADCLPRKDSDLQGVWKAEFKLNNQTMPVDMRVAELSAGTFRAEVTSTSIGMLMPASSINYERPAITIEFGGAGATFEGKIDNDNSRISGTVTIGGKPQSVIFKRTDAAAEQARDAEKDFSHDGPNDLPGHWQGTLTVQKVKLRLKLEIAKMPGDQLDCTMFSLDQGAAAIPASKVNYNSPKVRLEWSAINGTFTGELKSGKLSGTWKQGGGTFPLVFDRIPGK